MKAIDSTHYFATPTESLAWWRCLLNLVEIVVN